MTEEKTEQASAKKLKKARQDGRVAKSAEFTATAAAVASLAALVLSRDIIAAEFVNLFDESIRLASNKTVARAQITPFLYDAFFSAARILGPIVATAFVVAGLVAYLQIGPVFALKTVIPDGSRLNPASGFKQLFDKAKLVELVKNVGKLTVMGAVGYVVYVGLLAGLIRTPRLELLGAMTVLGRGALRLAQFLVGGLIAFAVIDLIWQRHKFGKDMMMSKKEVKDEYKEAEGSPEIKGRRRQLHRELLAQGSVSRVKDADAVVVNPTHIAVAIRYREEEAEVPVVLAKGRGPIAGEMRRLARKFDIPVVRDVPLARALVVLEDDEGIPEELFEAVAEVLKYVYSLRSEG
jgi:flagellar biosynthetic protein FlhB